MYHSKILKLHLMPNVAGVPGHMWILITSYFSSNFKGHDENIIRCSFT